MKLSFALSLFTACAMGRNAKAVQCGDTVDSSMTLNLGVSDLLFDCDCTEKPALTVNGTGIKIDLGGINFANPATWVTCDVHKPPPIGPIGKAIVVNGQGNSVTNGIVAAAVYGVSLKGEGGHTVSNLFVVGIVAGVCAESSDNTVDSVTIQHVVHPSFGVVPFGNGIFICGPFAQNNTISNNVIVDGDENGIIIINGTGNVVINNTISGMGNLGVFLAPGCNDNLIKGNIITNTKSAGIEIYNASRNLMIENQLTNVTVGIHMEQGGKGNQLIDNQVSNAYEVGIGFSLNATLGPPFHDDIIVQGNKLTNNDAQGLLIQGCSDCKFTENDIVGNFLSGIQIKSSTGCKFTKNTVKRNGGSGGIMIDSDSVGTELIENTIENNAQFDCVDYGQNTDIKPNNDIADGSCNPAFTPPTGNLGTTNIEVTIPSSVTIGNVACVVGEEASLQKSVQASLQASSCPTGSNCSVKVNSLECKSRRRHFRGLESTASSLVAEFGVILTVYCQTNDCSDANEVVQAVYENVKKIFRAAIADSSFITALRASSSATAFPSSSIGLDAVTFEQFVAPLLEALTDWYPSWHDGTSTCLNDGNAPLYMKNGYFIKNSLEDCCNSFYSWDFTKCMILGGASSSAYATNEFYVDYQTGSCKQSCLEGTAGLNCAGIAYNWMNVFATAEECCEKTLWWVEASTCVAHSTLTPSTTAAGSSKWYGDYTKNKCVKDCVNSSDAQCGGLAKSWDITFPTSGECCSKTLWWVLTKDCTSS